MNTVNKGTITGLLQEPDLNTGRGLARAISLVENSVPGYDAWLASLKPDHTIPVIGITGPPGAGKSTLVNGMISYYAGLGKKVGVIAVDPTSPFNLGSLLGDRIRMSEHYLNPNVFIRSLASRGSLGGLSAKALEVSDVMRCAAFDIIIVETVGVGQSEVEIAGLADVTLVVLVPEAGDEIQGLKSGIMEIADIFVVNKADRPGAQGFIANLKKILHQRPDSQWAIPVLPAIATKNEGPEAIAQSIEKYLATSTSQERRPMLFAEKAVQLIQQRRMQGISRRQLAEDIKKAMLADENFNLYRFIQPYLAG